MLMSVISFNIRNRNLKIEISFVWYPPLPFPFSLVIFVEQGGVLALHLRLILKIKTFSTHFKANYNKLETQNGGGVRLLVKAFKMPWMCENVKFARFMDYGPSLWIDKSTKRNINKDSFLRILASVVA